MTLSLPSVTAERSGWRDPLIAKRHALYHDIDAANNTPVAIIDYKAQGGRAPSRTDPSASQRVYTDLADRASLPAFCIFIEYSRIGDVLRVRYTVHGLNRLARAAIRDFNADRTPAEFNEIDYAAFQRHLIGAAPMTTEERDGLIQRLGPGSAMDVDNWSDGETWVLDSAGDWEQRDYSSRHREYQWDVPTLDLDGVLTAGGTLVDTLWAEFDQFRTVGLVLVARSKQSLSAVDSAALKALSAAANVTCWRIVYDPATWHYTVQMPGEASMRVTEAEYVSALYRLRGRVVPDGLIETIAR